MYEIAEPWKLWNLENPAEHSHKSREKREEVIVRRNAKFIQEAETLNKDLVDFSWKSDEPK